MRLAPLLGLALAVSAFAAPHATAAAGCNAGAKVDLDIAAAAAVPAVKSDKLTTFGASEARSQASRLTAGAPSVCNATPSAATGRAFARVDALVRAGKRDEAKALLRQTFAQVEKETKKAQAARALLTRFPMLVKGGGCPDQAGHISLKIKSVSDNLALATKAQELKDDRLAAQAMDAARAALRSWMLSAENKASTVGDWLRIQQAGEQLGSAQVQQAAAGRARGQANLDVRQAAQFDACTVKKGDFDCWARTIATAQLVGAFQDEQLQTAAKLGQAIEDRLHRKAPNGCEEWTFTMTATMPMKNTGDTWSIKWGSGKFRVNRAEGLLDGSYEAGYIPDNGWSGIVGSATDACIETVDGREINRGPASIVGGAFHYRFEGEIDDSTITLTVPSDDATVHVTAPPDAGCQFLAALAEGVLTGLMRGGVPCFFEVTREQETATYQYSDEQGTVMAQIRRSPLTPP
jgi:hypothetical protein